eukprot:4610731-Prymnesium_polylepis.1
MIAYWELHPLACAHGHVDRDASDVRGGPVPAPDTPPSHARTSRMPDPADPLPCELCAGCRIAAGAAACLGVRGTRRAASSALMTRGYVVT